MSRTYFFATGSDLIRLLWHLEDRFNIRYSQARGFGDSPPKEWTQASDLPHFGQATADQEIGCEAFHLKSAIPMPPDKISLKHFGPLEDHPQDLLDFVLLRKGGFWSDGSLISGHLIAMSEGVFARKLMNRSRSGFRKSFTRIGAYWVGPEALELLRAGTRLCVSIHSPALRDLREP